MVQWKIVPIGKAILMLHPEEGTEEQYMRARDMCEHLIRITGMPWICLFSADLVDAKTVKEIAERFYGIKS